MAFAPNQMVARHLNLRWGVVVVPDVQCLDPAEMIDYVTKTSKDLGYVKEGDITVITSGIKYGAGGTSAIQLHTI